MEIVDFTRFYGIECRRNSDLSTNYHPSFVMLAKTQRLTHQFLVMPNWVIRMVSTRLGRVVSLIFPKKEIYC